MTAENFKRPVSRIDPTLSEFKKLWHFYPEHSLLALLMETTLAANAVDSDLPEISYLDIEDIAYPEGHSLHATRNLEMGFKLLHDHYKDKPLPPVPIQTGVLSKVALLWHKNPQMRLGQLLSLPNLLEANEGIDQADAR